MYVLFHSVEFHVVWNSEYEYYFNKTKYLWEMSKDCPLHIDLTHSYHYSSCSPRQSAVIISLRTLFAPSPSLYLGFYNDGDSRCCFKFDLRSDVKGFWRRVDRVDPSPLPATLRLFH